MKTLFIITNDLFFPVGKGKRRMEERGRGKEAAEMLIKIFFLSSGKEISNQFLPLFGIHKALIKGGL